MFKCKIFLCAFLFALKYNNIYVISQKSDQYVPLEWNIDNSDSSILDCLYNIIDEHTNAKPNLVSLYFLDVKKEDDTIAIYYVCRLPIDSKINNAYNITLQSASNHPIIKKAIAYV